MDATFQSTVQSTNISLNQAKGVSINVETLQTIKQLCNIDTLGSRFKVQGSMSLPRLYRHQLRMVRTLSRAMDGHPTLSNIGLLLMGLALMVEIFLYA